ncbi:hypothetical protein EKO04_011499 [Ascochyta lentis]|uniref:Lipocalin-like domain-containing protein n=1 Tax=Ascochyta lentis TaxID=205686 RepID=A0A8H7MBD1_9PLEO|nr:hypothetical protein EKO04_011499 [Ascochyta lentis]
MRFIIATMAATAMAASAGAGVYTGGDLGGWNVSYVQSGGSDRSHSTHIYGVYSNAQLKDNIAVDCYSLTVSDGKIFSGHDPTTLTCSPPSFTYQYNGTDSTLTLTQIVELSDTTVTVEGTSKPFTTKLDLNGKGAIAHDIIFQATTGVQ